MNILQAIESLSELPDYCTVCISARNYGTRVTLYIDDGLADNAVSYGMVEKEAEDIDDLIKRIIAARDTALEYCTPAVTRKQMEIANAEADEMLHQLNDRPALDDE